MTMRIKARLTTEVLRHQPELDWRDDHNLQRLATLFVGDPMVAHDDTSYYLAATAIDDEDDKDTGRWRDVADQLLRDLNGITAVLASGSNDHPAIFDYDRFEGVTSRTRIRISGIWVHSMSLSGLDPASAASLLPIAETDPWVSQVLGTLAHLDRQWIWVDLWRIWDVVGSYYPDKKKGDGAFRRWVQAQPVIGSQYYDFSRSANDPDMSGRLARHGARGYRPRKDAKRQHHGQKDDRRRGNYVHQRNRPALAPRAVQPDIHNAVTDGYRYLATSALTALRPLSALSLSRGIAHEAVGVSRRFPLSRKLPLVYLRVLEGRNTMAGKSNGKARSAITGRYVTPQTAARHPRTTVVEKPRPKK